MLKMDARIRNNESLSKVEQQLKYLIKHNSIVRRKTSNHINSTAVNFSALNRSRELVPEEKRNHMKRERGQRRKDKE